jgi:hypothetical protein
VQIVQKKIDEITIRLEGNPADHSGELEHLCKLIVGEFGDVFRFNLEGVEEIKRAASGKYQYVISEVERP